MTKKEYCLKNPAIAYHDELSGFEIHGMEYGIDDYAYCVAGASSDNKTYHRLKIRYDCEHDVNFVSLYGRKILLTECIRISG